MRDNIELLLAHPAPPRDWWEDDPPINNDVESLRAECRKRLYGSDFAHGLTHAADAQLSGALHWHDRFRKDKQD